MSYYQQRAKFMANLQNLSRDKLKNLWHDLNKEFIVQNKEVIKLSRSHKKSTLTSRKNFRRHERKRRSLQPPPNLEKILLFMKNKKRNARR